MTRNARIGRIGWFAALGICTALYLGLHFKVQSVVSEVVRAERQIVALEERNMLLETEFLSRSNQAQLAAWNRVDFGYVAPDADQFISGERQLAQFSEPRSANAPAPIRLASMTATEERPRFAELVSPLTGEPVDPALVEPAAAGTGGSIDIGSVARGREVGANVGMVQGPMRITLNAVAKASLP